MLPDVLLDATDRDTQGGDSITYTIVNILGAQPLGAHLFSPSDVTSNVYVDDVIVIDTPGEASVVYQLEVHVFDSFGLTTAAPARLNITVTDINDNPPVFNPTVYTGIVSGKNSYQTNQHVFKSYFYNSIRRLLY